MSESIYQVLVQAGVFQVVFDNEDSPAEYRGDALAIQHFKDWLLLNQISGYQGARINPDNITPDELYGFCQPTGSGIIVIPPIDDLIAYAKEEAMDNAESPYADKLDALMRRHDPECKESKSQFFHRTLKNLLGQDNESNQPILDSTMQVSGIEKLKLVKELGGIRGSMASVSSGIAKLQLVKRLGEIRVILGGVAAVDVPEPETIEPETGKPATQSEATQAIKYLKGFIGLHQLNAIGSGMRGEEKQFFFDKMVALAAHIKKMPKTYDQDGLGDKSIAYLHYFKNNMDWYITERDMDDDNEGQLQAFGLANLGHGGEMGYISIVELIKNNVEIDLYWEPQTIRKIKGDDDTDGKTEFELAQEKAKAEYEAQEANKPVTVWERKDAANPVNDLEIFTQGGRFKANWSGRIQAYDTLEDAKGQIRVWANGLGIDDVFGERQAKSDDMEQFIKIAADSIEQLRKQDVFRVLDTYSYDEKLADYITTKRPDLAQEVEELMAEARAYVNDEDAPEPNKETGRFSPGDIVYLEDAYDANKRIPVNFRGYLDKEKSIVVMNGSQMAIETNRLFKEDIQGTGTITDPEPAIEEETLPTPEPTTGNPEIDNQKRKLLGLQRLQDQMKAANKILKNAKLSDELKQSGLTELGYSEGEVYKLMRPDFAGRIGFSYHLTNNNAVIKNTQKRIAQLEAKDLAESQAASGNQETSYDFDGGTIDLDYGDDRLRVNFDSKPNPEMISRLKQNGFKWSPTNTAWQRQLTDNAISTANYLFGTTIKTAASLMNEAENAPRPNPIVAAPLVDPIKAAFEAELAELATATDGKMLDKALDDIMERLDAAGLSEALDVPLNAAVDRMTYLMAEAEKAA